MDFLFLCSTLWATVSSLTTTVKWTSPSPSLPIWNRPSANWHGWNAPSAVSMCSWQTNASRSFPWSSSRTNKRKSFSITTILNGKTKPYNTTYCIRTALSYCSAWIRVPAPSFANSIPMSSSIPKPAPSLSSSPQRAAWATTGRCMHTCEKMP